MNMIYARKYMVVPFKEDISEKLFKKEEKDYNDLSEILLEPNISDGKKYNTYNEKLKKMINKSKVNDNLEKEKLYKTIEKLLEKKIGPTQKTSIIKSSFNKRNMKKNTPNDKTKTEDKVIASESNKDKKRSRKNINYNESPALITRKTISKKKNKNTKQNSNQNKVVQEQNNNKEEEHMELENTTNLLTEDDRDSDEDIKSEKTAINYNKIRKVASLSPISKNMITKHIDKDYRFNRYINDEDLLLDPYKTEANWDIPKF